MKKYVLDQTQLLPVTGSCSNGLFRNWCFSLRRYHRLETIESPPDFNRSSNDDRVPTRPLKTLAPPRRITWWRGRNDDVLFLRIERYSEKLIVSSPCYGCYRESLWFRRYLCSLNSFHAVLIYFHNAGRQSIADIVNNSFTRHFLLATDRGTDSQSPYQTSYVEVSIIAVRFTVGSPVRCIQSIVWCRI